MFDVSFGAELTVKSYLEYIRARHPEMVISQPCPAIVTFVEIYMPELLPYLAPADSMAEMINQTDEMSTGSTQIMDTLAQLNDITQKVKGSTAIMDETIEQMKESLLELTDMSQKTLSGIDELAMDVK